MKRIIFRHGKVTIRVREVVIFLILLLLFFLLVQCNTKEKTRTQKMEAVVQETCTFPKKNIKDLNDLLSRGDLCSEVWFDNVDTFKTRLKDQNKILKKQSSKKKQALYHSQVNLVKALEAFEKKQDKKTIDTLEKVFKEYQKLSKKGCS